MQYQTLFHFYYDCLTHIFSCDDLHILFFYLFCFFFVIVLVSRVIHTFILENNQKQKQTIMNPDKIVWIFHRIRIIQLYSYILLAIVKWGMSYLNRDGPRMAPCGIPSLLFAFSILKWRSTFTYVIYYGDNIEARNLILIL